MIENNNRKNKDLSPISERKMINRKLMTVGDDGVIFRKVYGHNYVKTIRWCDADGNPCIRDSRGEWIWDGSIKIVPGSVTKYKRVNNSSNNIRYDSEDI